MKHPLLLLAVAGFTLSPVALAVEAAAEEEVERIEVTGSRIKGIDLEGAQPLVVLDAEDIKGSSANTVSDLLREVSQTRGGTGSFNTASSNAISTGNPAGQAAASLRGLGASSTLTLINGRRVSVSSFASGTENFVDVNSIPLAAIERIEILPSGASALYGADAVAGVINYILKKDFEGFELNASYGDSEADSDDTKKNLNLVFGKNFANSNLTAYVDYYDRNALHLRDRDQTKDSFFPNQQGPWASYNTLFFDFPQDLVDPNCPDDQRFDDRPGFPAESFFQYCAYDSNDFRPYQPEFESWGAGANYTMSFDNGMEWFNEFTYNFTESEASSSSAPLNGLEIPFFDPRDPGQLHPSLLNEDGSLNPIGQEFVDLYDDLFGGIIDDAYQIYGRLPDSRTIENETSAIRFVTGLKGEWNEWSWETAISASRSESEQRGVQGIALRDRLEAALNGALCADGSICEPGEGYLVSPWDAWAPRADGVNDPAAWDLIYSNVPRDGESNLYTWDANITGDLFELDAGTVSVALGAEYRREEIEDIPSADAEGTFENNFETNAVRFGATRADADRNTWGIYAEFYLPLTDNLDMQLAGRYDDYDDFDGQFNPMVRLRYQPLDSLVLRASYAEAFRAPSLSQVGTDVKLSSAVVNCVEGLEGFDDCIGASDTSIDTIEFGNPDLDGEDATTYNLGLAWSATDDITLTIDYWNIEHEDLVDVDAEELLLRALSDPSLLYCDSVPAGEREGVAVRCDESGAPLTPFIIDGDVHVQLQNLGTQDTDGIDFSYTHDFQLLDLDWTFLVDGTYVLNFDRTRTASIGEEELAGTYQYPEWVMTSKLKFDTDKWFGNLTMRYTDGYEDNDLASLSDFDLERLGVSPNREVPSWTVFDAQLGYELNEQHTFRVTVENLFDRDAPVVYGSSQNVDSYNHDIMGRYYRLSYTFRY